MFRALAELARLFRLIVGIFDRKAAEERTRKDEVKAHIDALGRDDSAPLTAGDYLRANDRLNRHSDRLHRDQ